MTLKTIGTLGSEDYSTVAGWISATPSNLVSTTQTWEGEMSAETFPEDNLRIGNGVTTSSTYYIRLAGKDSMARTGTGFDPCTPNSGARIQPTGSMNHVNPVGSTVTVDNVDCILEDFEIDLGGYTGFTAGTAVGFAPLSPANATNAFKLLMRRCSVYGATSSIDAAARRGCFGSFPTGVNDGNVHWVLSRCVVGPGTTYTNSNDRGYSLSTQGNSEIVQINCTAQGLLGPGFSGAQEGTKTLFNCLAVDNGGSDFTTSGAGTNNWDYCASEDLTADDQGGVGNITGVTAADEIRTLDTDLHVDEAGVCWDGGGTPVITTFNGWNINSDQDPAGGTMGNENGVSYWPIGASGQSYITKLIKATGGDYATIAGFISATPSTLDAIWCGEMASETFPEDSLTPGTSVTTDTLRYFVLRGQNSLARTGTGFSPLVPNSGARIRNTGTYASVSERTITPENDKHLIFEDFEIDLGGYTAHTTGAPICMQNTTGVGPARMICRRLLLHGWNIGSIGNGWRGFLITHGGTTTAQHISAFVRCVVGPPDRSDLGQSHRAYALSNGATNQNGEVHCINCTAQGMAEGTTARGFQLANAHSTGYVRLLNCLSIDNLNEDFIELNGTGTSDWDYCASDDLTADDQGGTGHQTGVTAANEVRTLDSNWNYGASGVAWDSGTDPSGLTIGTTNPWELYAEVDPNGFGTNRGDPYKTTTPWPIGASGQGYIIESIKATGGDYATIGGWISGTPSTLNTILIGELADEDFNEAALQVGSGVTADQTRYLILRGANSVARTGTGFNVLVPNSGARIRPTDNNPTWTYLVSVVGSYMICEDFEIDNSATTGTPTQNRRESLRRWNSTTVRCIVRRVLLIGEDTSKQNDGLVFIMQTGGQYAYAVRVVAYSFMPSGGEPASGDRGRPIQFDTWSGGSGQFNCEAYNCVADLCDAENAYGIGIGTHSTAGSGGKIKTRNLVATRCTEAGKPDIAYTGGGGSDFSDHDHANNASEDSSANGYGCTNAITGITPDSEYVTLGSDYHLETSAPNLLGTGAGSLAGLTTVGPDAWPLLVEIDPDGETIGGSYSRGADNHGHQSYPLPHRWTPVLIRI